MKITALLKHILATIVCALHVGIAVASEAPFILVLGVAQDAGYPQANCYQPHCMRAWENPDLQRLTSSIAVIAPDSGNKYLFDATPDIRQQLFELHSVAPDGQFTLGGVFLTHGHIGHYTGIMHFGHEASGSKNVPIFAMPRMHRYLTDNGPWSQLVSYQNISLVELSDGVAVKLPGQLRVTPILVPHRDEYTEAVGYRIEGPSKSAIFIPDINKWDQWKADVRDLIRSVDYALLDATFFADGELPGRDMSQIMHPFVSESMDLFSNMSAEEKHRVIFIHFNHTNPLLIDGSPEQQKVLELGFRFARQGMKLPL